MRSGSDVVLDEPVEDLDERSRVEFDLVRAGLRPALKDEESSLESVPRLESFRDDSIRPISEDRELLGFWVV